MNLLKIQNQHTKEKNTLKTKVKSLEKKIPDGTTLIHIYIKTKFREKNCSRC